LAVAVAVAGDAVHVFAVGFVKGVFAILRGHLLSPRQPIADRIKYRCARFGRQPLKRIIPNEKTAYWNAQTERLNRHTTKLLIGAGVLALISVAVTLWSAFNA
jgi:hypothetical protein